MLHIFHSLGAIQARIKDQKNYYPDGLAGISLLVEKVESRLIFDLICSEIVLYFSKIFDKI